MSKAEDGLGVTKSLVLIVSILMRVVGFGVAVVGLGAVLFGFAGTPDGPPTCDGEVMSPGDRCWTQYGGDIDINSYEDIMRRRQSEPDPGQQLLTVGGLSLGGGVVLLVGSWWLPRRTFRDD